MPQTVTARGWTIRAQLTFVFLCFALLSAATGGITLARLYAAAEETATLDAVDVAETLAYIVTDVAPTQRSLFDDRDRLDGLIAALHEREDRSLAVVDRAQRILADADVGRLGAAFVADPRDEVGSVIRSGVPIAFQGTSADQSDGVRMVAVPIRREDTDDVVGAIVYEYAPQYAALISKADGSAVWIIAATLAAFALAIIVALVLGGRLAGPLDELTRDALAIARADDGGGRHEIHVPSSATREVVGLAEAINRLRGALDERVGVARLDAQRAGTLTRLGEMIAFSDSESELVEAAMGTIDRMVASTGGNLLLLNPSEDRLTIGGVWGAAEGEPGAVVPIDRPSRCPGIRRGSPYVVTDASDRLQAHCRAFPAATGSLLCIPMLALGKVVGVIHVHADHPGAFDDRDREVITRVAGQSALALSNARLIQTMEGLAMTDGLTGLHNGRFFDPLLERELAVAERDGLQVGLIMLDLDHFKRFNDTHGHPAGDEALKAFARAAQGALRESDVVARYGGEEFVVMARGADLEGTALIAEKLRAAVENTVVNVGPGRTARITVSAGVSSTAGHGQDRMVLLRVADEALYQAKQDGRNRVVVSRPLFAMRDAGRPPIVRRPPARTAPPADVPTAPSREPAAVTD